MNDRRLEMMPIAGIATATRNPKDHDIGELSKSIGRFGFADGLIFDERTQRLVAGHGRLEALRALQRAGGEPPEGITRTVAGEWLVPVQRGWASKSDADADAFIIAANRISEIGGWDQKALDQMLVELSKGGEAALSGVGFDGDDVDRILRELAPPPAVGPQIDRAEELRKEWKVETGQLWVLGEHRLLCGDSTKRDDVGRVIGGRCDVMFTSPPYALGKSASLSGNRSMRQRGNAYDLHDDNTADWPSLMRGFVEASRGSVDCMAINVQPLAGNKRALLSWAAENAAFLVDVMVWNKGHAQPPMAAGVLTSSFELVFVFGAANASRAIPYSSWRGNVSAVVDIPPQRNNDFAKEHGATMPVALASHFVGVVFDTCETVYDPFSGSGTTIIACEQLGRKCRAIEISPGYVAVALQRFKDATGKTPTLEGELP